MRDATRRLRDMLIGVLLLALGVYAGFAAHLYLTQDQRLYFPERHLAETPDRFGLVYDDVRLRTDDGVALHGWYLTAAAQPRATVLYLHGNAGNIANGLDTARQLVLLGLNVLLVDYRGYGESAGVPSEQGMERDAEAAWRYLLETRHAAPQEVVVYGYSLGGAVAAQLAARHTPGALIVEAAFTSLPERAAELYPWLPVRWLSRYRYDTAAALGKVHCPVLIVHSKDDEVVPFMHGLRLYDAAPGPKILLELNGGHNDAMHTSLLQYTRGVDGFLTRYMPP